MRVRPAQIRVYQRNQRGAAFGTLMFLVVLLCSFVAAAISADVAHNTCVRAELSAAADAAAIAGEEILLANKDMPESKAIAAAQSICGKNVADGRRIDSNPSCKVSVKIGRTEGSPSLPTTQVVITIPIRNLFAAILGRSSDVLIQSAKAGPGEVKTAFSAFPLTVINRDYKPNTLYTWYISDAPGLVPDLVNRLNAGLLGYSTGSTPPAYPETMLGYNTARFLTPFSSTNDPSLVGAATGLLDGVGGGLGLGKPGTVLGGYASPALGLTGSTVNSLLTSGNQASKPDLAALHLLHYFAKNLSPHPSSSGFQLTTNTQPRANGGSWPQLPAQPLAPTAVMLGQRVQVTSGANNKNNNALNTTVQYMQGSLGNRGSGTILSHQVTGRGLPGGGTAIPAGTTASWLNDVTIIVPTTSPVADENNLTLPILDINVLGFRDATATTYSTNGNGLLGSLPGKLLGMGDATPTSATIDRFIAIKIRSVSVEYQGASGLSVLGLGVLDNPWAQQVVRITGEVQPYAGFAGYGGSSRSSNSSSRTYAAMLIE